MNKTKEPTKKKVNIIYKILNLIQQAKIFNKKTVKYIVTLIAFLFITNPSLIPFLPKGIKNTLTDALKDIFGDVTQISKVIQINWITIFQIFVMILSVIILMNIIKSILHYINPKNRRIKTMITIFDSANQYICIIICIIWGLRIIGIDINTIIASVGIAALIIGFSAESLIADVVTGTFLLLENQYNVGDIIEVGDFRGTIEKIGIRTTSIKDAGNNIKVITNSDMRNVINRSSIKSKAVCDIRIPIDQNIVIAEKVLAKWLKEIHNKYSEIFNEEPQYLGIQSLGEKDMTLRIVASVEEESIFNAQRILNREILLGFQKENILSSSK